MTILTGELLKKQNKWVVRELLGESELPLHPTDYQLVDTRLNHHGMLVRFEVMTAADGTSEWDVMDTDFAKLMNLSE